MKAQRYGRIINISSSAGRMGSTVGGALHLIEGGTPRLHTRGGEGTRRIRHHRERHLPRHDRHGTDARERIGGATGAARGELPGTTSGTTLEVEKKLS